MQTTNALPPKPPAHMQSKLSGAGTLHVAAHADKACLTCAIGVYLQSMLWVDGLTGTPCVPSQLHGRGIKLGLVVCSRVKSV